jgi:hypothetical protein
MVHAEKASDMLGGDAHALLVAWKAAIRGGRDQDASGSASRSKAPSRPRSKPAWSGPCASSTAPTRPPSMACSRWRTSCRRRTRARVRDRLAPAAEDRGRPCRGRGGRSDHPRRDHVPSSREFRNVAVVATTRAATRRAGTNICSGSCPMPRRQPVRDLAEDARAPAGR